MSTAPPRLLAVGDNVVDVYPDDSVLFPGGNAVNVAVHARRCRAQSAYIGAIGTDHAGQAVLAALRAEGVDTSRTRVVQGPNAHAIVHLVQGNRIFGSGDVGISRFRLSPDDLAAAGSYDVVHTGECSMLEDQLPDLRSASRLLSIDVSERPWDYVQEYARHAHVAIQSCPVHELSAAKDHAVRLRALGPSVVAVTVGAAGAVVLDEDGWWVSRPVPPPGGVVDTLGAGDAFSARFLSGLVSGEGPQQRLDAATAYATASCLSHGAFGYPTALPAVSAPQATPASAPPVSMPATPVAAAFSSATRRTPSLTPTPPARLEAP